MKKTLIIISVLAAPMFAFAQNSTGDLYGLVTLVGRIVNLLVPLVATLAIVFFFWGLARYILNAGDEEKKKEGRDIMIWGVLALFVLVTIWGIIGFMQRTVGNTGGPQNVNIVTPGVNAGQATYSF